MTDHKEELAPVSKDYLDTLCDGDFPGRGIARQYLLYNDAVYFGKVEAAYEFAKANHSESLSGMTSEDLQLLADSRIKIAEAGGTVSPEVMGYVKYYRELAAERSKDNVSTIQAC